MVGIKWSAMRKYLGRYDGFLTLDWDDIIRLVFLHNGGVNIQIRTTINLRLFKQRGVKHYEKFNICVGVEVVLTEI